MVSRSEKNGTVLHYSIGRKHETSPLLELWLEIIISNLKYSRYRPGVAQRVGRGTALLFHDRGTRRR